jgi:hypothetical protein
MAANFMIFAACSLSCTASAHVFDTGQAALICPLCPPPGGSYNECADSDTGPRIAQFGKRAI